MFLVTLGRIWCNCNLRQGFAIFLGNGFENFVPKKIWLITDSLYLVFHLLENTGYTLVVGSNSKIKMTGKLKKYEDSINSNDRAERHKF